MPHLSFLSKTAIALLLLDCAIILAHIFWRDSLGFFDLDKEGNLKGVFSGFQLLVIAISSGALAFLSSRLAASRTQRTAWALVSLLFVYLALDDMMTIHERVGFVLNRWVGVNDRPFESFNWLAYYAPFILAGAALVGWAVRSVAHIQKKLGWIAGGGLCLLMLSLALELLGRQLLIAGAIPLYRIEMIAEEAAMLFGETLFLAAIATAGAQLFERAFVARK